MADLAVTDLDGDGLPEHGGVPDQTYDTWPMTGPSAYGGSLWLAALAAAEAMARRVGDDGPRRLGAWFDSGQAPSSGGSGAAPLRLRRGGGPARDSIMADQLAGQWYADATGLGDLVPPTTSRRAAHRPASLNVVRVRRRADGRRQRHAAERLGRRARVEQSAEVWVGTTYALAAFMMGRGMVEEGWETAPGPSRSRMSVGCGSAPPKPRTGTATSGRVCICGR